MGFNDTVDVTIVGSGPNGLTAAVICARAGLSVRVCEAQPTAGGGARTRPGPRSSPGVRHDICSAVHPLALASPFFAEFDLRARGVQLAVPEISYANPLPNHPAAIGYRDLTRTCAELDDGASWRTLLGPLARPPRRRAQPVPRRQAVDPVGPAHRGARRAAAAAAGHPGVGPAAGRGRPCAVHRRCRTYDFADALAGVVGGGADAGDARARGRLAHPGRWFTVDHRLAHRRPAGPRRRTACSARR